MARRGVGLVLRWVATAVMGLGVALFVAGALGGVLILREGVTGLVGEGDRLPAESPEQVRRRLALVGGLLGATVCGWVLARLGDVYQQVEPRRPCVTRLAAELLLLLGGAGLAAGVLLWCGPRSAGYECPEVYHRLGTMALVGGPVCLGLGCVLLRRSARHSNTAVPAAPTDRPRD